MGEITTCSYVDTDDNRYIFKLGEPLFVVHNRHLVDSPRYFDTSEALKVDEISFSRFKHLVMQSPLGQHMKKIPGRANRIDFVNLEFAYNDVHLATTVVNDDQTFRAALRALNIQKTEGLSVHHVPPPSK